MDEEAGVDFAVAEEAGVEIQEEVQLGQADVVGSMLAEVGVVEILVQIRVEVGGGLAAAVVTNSYR